MFLEATTIGRDREPPPEERLVGAHYSAFRGSAPRPPHYVSNNGKGEEELDEEVGQVFLPTSKADTETDRSSASKLESGAATPPKESPTAYDRWEQLQIKDKNLGSASDCASNKLTGVSTTQNKTQQKQK